MSSTMTIPVLVTPAATGTSAMVGTHISAVLYVNGMVSQTAKTVILWIFRRCEHGNNCCSLYVALDRIPPLEQES